MKVAFLLGALLCSLVMLVITSMIAMKPLIKGQSEILRDLESISQSIKDRLRKIY